MGTPWSEIITDYFDVVQSDIRLKEQLANSPALFFRAMSLYMKNAIPRFNRPPEMKAYLSYVAPLFADYAWTSEYAETETVIHTGKTGFELMSAEIVSTDRFGNPTSIPYTEAAYDSETGYVTMPAKIAANTNFEFNFYTDGVFNNVLDDEVKRILGLCMQYVWETRFDSDWLNRTPKARDKSLETPNEANNTRANTERKKDMRAELDSEIRTFSQNVYYRNIVAKSKQIIIR